MNPRDPRTRRRTSNGLAALLGVFALALMAVTPAPAAADERPARSRSAAESTEVVNINTADAATLEELPGIGPAKARAILEVRERRGRFRRVRQILLVRGIGRATFRRLRPMVVVDGESTLE